MTKRLQTDVCNDEIQAIGASGTARRRPEHARRRAGAHSIICPNANCGYKGEPRKLMGFWRMFFIVPPFAFLLGSVYLMGVFSPLFILIPAFIGITHRYGRSPFCPKCRLKLAVSG